MRRADLLPRKRPALRSLGRAIKEHALLLLSLLGLMWALEIIDLLPFLTLDRFGIQPRCADGLVGIVCAPLLHAGFPHLLANTVPFLVLGGLVLLGGRALFWKVTLFVTLASGLCVWLFAAQHTNHIGASGLIFGYLGFLLARGFVERSLPWTMLAVVILILYGGILFGVLPTRARVSWQGHLFGFVAGIAAAHRLLPGRGRFGR